MDHNEFLKSVEDKKKNLHRDNIQDIMSIAVNPDSLSDEDLEYGEVWSGAQGSTSYAPTAYNGSFVIPRKQLNVSRSEYHKKVSEYYSQRQNFLTLVPLDDKKFKLVHGEAQNHFTPELAYYASVLYDEVINKIPDKEGGRIVITSGFRSVEYNNGLREKGYHPAQWSAHSCGMAIDILCARQEDRIKILDAAYRIGFGGLGLYDTFVHVDVSGRSMWGGYSAPRG